MDLRVGVHELDRERQAINTCIGKGDTAARDNTDPIVVGVGAVDIDRISRIG
jgi:hypothetical protein